MANELVEFVGRLAFGIFLKVPIAIVGEKGDKWVAAQIKADVVKGQFVTVKNDRGFSKNAIGASLEVPITCIYGIVGENIINYNSMGTGPDHELPFPLKVTVDIYAKQDDLVIMFKGNQEMLFDVWCPDVGGAP